jgi:hypothetical protein
MNSTPLDSSFQCAAFEPKNRCWYNLTFIKFVFLLRQTDEWCVPNRLFNANFEDNDTFITQIIEGSQMRPII